MGVDLPASDSSSTVHPVTGRKVPFVNPQFTQQQERADAPHPFGLLSARRERPRTQRSDELAPLDAVAQKGH